MSVTKPGFIRRHMMFRYWLWACSLAFIGLVLWFGTRGFMAMGTGFWDGLYRAVQLFGLNFDFPGQTTAEDIPLQLHIARLAAPAVLIVAVIKLMADGLTLRLQRHRNTRPFNFPRDLVLGFDSFGQEVGRRLIEKGNAVTWIDRIQGNDEDLRQARDRAERLGGFLIVGDPSDPRNLQAARIGLVRRVFVALPNDLACFDAVEAVRKLLPQHKPVRMFTANRLITNTLQTAAESGFATGRGVDLFNTKADAVRRLVLTARWDNLALLLGQERVHLVIAGCGWQGEALLEETLLLCLRANLKPPLVTVLDIDAEGVRKRLHRRAPALIDGNLGVRDFLPPRFVTADLDQVDFATLDLRETPDQPKVPVTAWAICAGDDDLNLRAGLLLHTAIQTRRLDGAPIHIRVHSGHGVATHAIGTDGITLSRTFGSLQDGLDQTSALEKDPDAGSKALHHAYVRAEADSPATKDPTTAPENSLSDWEGLSPSMRNSNRRAHRHAPMKLADLGFDWRRAQPSDLPTIAPEDRETYRAAHEALFARSFLDVEDTCSPQGIRLFRAMQNEHDRWCIDRALDGWQPGVVRDNARLIHPSMVPWKDIGKTQSAEDARKTRAYDAVLIRALLENENACRNRPARSACVVWIDARDLTNWHSSVPLATWMEATELRLSLPARRNAQEKDPVEAKQEQEFLAAVKEAIAGDLLCRIYLMFHVPPDKGVIVIANEIARLAEGRVTVDCALLWKAGKDKIEPLLP